MIIILNGPTTLVGSGGRGSALGQCGGSRHENMLRQNPLDLRAVVVNWEEVAHDLIRHLHEEIARAPSERVRALLADILRYPGVPARWRTREFGLTPPPLLTVVFRKDRRELRFFSTITTFATPHDVTLDEVRIECAFPADDNTAEVCREPSRLTWATRPRSTT